MLKSNLKNIYNLFSNIKVVCMMNVLLTIIYPTQILENNYCPNIQKSRETKQLYY